MNTKKKICQKLRDVYFSKYYSKETNASKLFRHYLNCYGSNDPKDVKFLDDFKDKLWPLFTENVRLAMEFEATSEPKKYIKIYKEEIAKIVEELNRLVDIEKIRASVDMGCPSCGTRLIFVERGCFETLDEHVSMPNGPIVKKDAFGCPNESCMANKAKMKWLEDGEGPYYDLTSSIKVGFIDDNNKPFRTFWRSMEGSTPKSHYFSIAGNWSLCVSISSKADYNGKKSWNKTIQIELLKNNIKKETGLKNLIISVRHYHTVPDYVRVNMFHNDLKYPNIRNKHWWHLVSFYIAKIVWNKDYKEALARI